MSITFDEPEIEPGGGPRGGGRRAVAVVGAVAIVAAAVVTGYAVGRADHDDQDTVPAAPDDSVVPEVPASTLPANDDEATTVTADAVTEDAAPAEEFASGAGMASASGGVGYSVFGFQPMELLAERTTPDGFTLRAHLGETWDQSDEFWGPGDWRPAPWCFESGQLRIALGGNGVADVGGVGWYREPFQGRAISSVLLGVADGLPRQVVVVQVPAKTASVAVTFADGATDSAVPQNGIALLSVPASMPELVSEDGYDFYDIPSPQFDVDIRGGSAPGVVAWDGTGFWDDAEFRAGCEPPPPELPEPGVQPDDPAAAEAAVGALMTALYDPSSRGVSGSYVDDPTGVDEAREEVAGGSLADVADSAEAVIEELVFTSPAEAWFRYRIESTNGAFGERFGVAVLIDGAWKITRDTICQDLSLAGGSCGAGWEPVVPPSADEGLGRFVPLD